MRFKTVGILSGVVIVVMFVFPTVMRTVFLPSLEQGTPTPIPDYERFLIGLAVFCLEFRWLLALPSIGALILFAVFTSEGQDK